MSHGSGDFRPPPLLQICPDGGAGHTRHKYLTALVVSVRWRLRRPASNIYGSMLVLGEPHFTRPTYASLKNWATNGHEEADCQSGLGSIPEGLGGSLAALGACTA